MLHDYKCTRNVIMVGAEQNFEAKQIDSKCYFGKLDKLFHYPAGV